MIAWHGTFFGLHDPHKYTQLGIATESHDDHLIGFMMVYLFSKTKTKSKQVSIV